MKFSLKVLCLFLIVTSAYAGRESGGGDFFTLDFVRIASEFIYPWLQDHGGELNPAVDAEAFIQQVSPLGISSTNHVFEMCDGTKKGREVDICYNANKNSFTISRTRYPIQDTSAMKVRLVAHEIFRKMGIEGDQYEISKQMSLLDANSSYISGPRIECAAEIVMNVSFFNNTRRFQIQLIAKANRGNPVTGVCSYRSYSVASNLGDARSIGLINLRANQLSANLMLGNLNVQLQLVNDLNPNGHASFVKSWDPVDMANPMESFELDSAKSSIVISNLKNRVPTTQQ